MDRTDFIFRLVGCLGAFLGIINSVFILNERRRVIRVSLLSHRPGESREEANFRMANPSRQAIRVRGIRLMAYVAKSKEWSSVSNEPKLVRKALELPLILKPGQSLDFNFSGSETFAANIFGKFYADVESELDEHFRSKKHKILSS